MEGFTSEELKYHKALRDIVFSPGFTDGFALDPTPKNNYNWIVIDTSDCLDEMEGIEDQLNAIELGY